MKLKATEYMYSSARVRAMENGIIGAHKLRSLADSKSLSEVLEKLSSFGLKQREAEDGAGGGIDAALADVLSCAYAETCDMTPADCRAFEWLKMPYDCNNLKLAIKCRIRNTSADELLFDFGLVSASDTLDSVFAGDYSAFPRNMAEAASLAVDEYAKTRDPQRIDTLLDRACYADMLECARESGEVVFVDWVRTKIDLTNVMITLRLIRMNRAQAGKMFLEGALLLGGELDTESLLRAYDSGEEELFALILRSKYSKFATAAQKTDMSLSAIEKCSDDYYMTLVKEAKWLPFGAPILAAYLVAKEYEVKNIRIILAAKNAGLSGDVIFERLRESYV
ncbi:MAG: V-type ATPase subunit [Clostridia bacterium]|nr:V-type ATPase subunit [Clostridia bacterium]